MGSSSEVQKGENAFESKLYAHIYTIFDTSGTIENYGIKNWVILLWDFQYTSKSLITPLFQQAFRKDVEIIVLIETFGNRKCFGEHRED